MTGLPWWLAGLLLLLLVASRLRTRHHLKRLTRWAEAPIGTPVPDAGGLWGDAFSALSRKARAAAEARRQLQNELDRLDALTQALPEGVVILGPGQTMEWLNGQATIDLGLDGERDLHAPITNFMREPEFIRHLEVPQHGVTLTLRCQRNPGRTLQFLTAPFGPGKTLLLTRDVTQLERLETMRRDFVANVSHELKTPLTVVSGFIETLRDGYADIPADEAAGYLALAAEQSGRMQRLIDDLLTLSALETGAPPPAEERIDMRALMAEVREEIVALSAGRHEIRLDDSGPAWLRGSARELRSACGNLASNAVRYTQAGGSIVLAWKALADGGAEYLVTDSGAGIESQHIPRLTERFYRVDRGRSRESGGTGLGLAIVKHVVERHQARLAIESQPGKGSTFRIGFPASRVAA